MRIVGGACALVFSLFAAPKAEATAVIDIDLSTQTMHVRANRGNYDWRVSTARSGYVTPRGHYRPISLQRMHYSRKYDMTPMPYAIFFRGGYAIHGTYSTAQLGRPVSHGCIRLAPGNAALLFAMVKAEGGSISISGTPPRSLYAKARWRGHGAAYARFHDHRRAGSAYAAWRGSPPSALSYAPARRAPIAARASQIINPVFQPRPLFWPTWP